MTKLALHIVMVNRSRIALSNREDLFIAALSDIAAMETPGAAPAARRMANRAREALK